MDADVLVGIYAAGIVGDAADFETHGGIARLRRHFDLDPRAPFVVPAEFVLAGTDHQVIADDADLGKGVEQERQKVGIAGPRVEPEDVILLGGAAPDGKGREGGHINGGQRIGRTTQVEEAETQNIARGGQSVHVVGRSITGGGNQGDAAKAVGMGFEAVAQIGVVFKLRAAGLHQYGAIDMVPLHFAQQPFYRRGAFGRHLVGK